MAKHGFCGPCDDRPNGFILHVTLGSKSLELLLKTYCTTDHLQLGDHQDMLSQAAWLVNKKDDPLVTIVCFAQERH